MIVDKPGTNAVAGDVAILVAMHVSTRETARWTWQTFWWTPTPENPHAPSSPNIAMLWSQYYAAHSMSQEAIDKANEAF